MLQSRVSARFGASTGARRCVVRRATDSSVTARTVPLPTRPEDQVQQAIAAVEAAFRDGKTRQKIELQLPLIGATDLDDWPGGVRQQFKAVQPMAEALLKSIKQLDGLQGALTPEIWDDGDAVVCYKSDNLAAVIFPTAPTLDKVKKLTEGPNPPKLLLLINTQWEGGGEFGFGPWRAAKEALVATFPPTYALRQQRVYGDQVRVLYAYPGQWQVYMQNPGGSNILVKTQDTFPTYQQIEDALRARPDASINKSVAQRLQEEWEFNRKSLDEKL